MDIKKQMERIIPSSSATIHRLYDKERIEINEIKRLTKRNVEMESNALFMNCMANHIRKVHYETFHHYKDSLIGKDIALIGTGPTLKFYSLPPNTLSIGCNTAYKYLDMDYYFVQDFKGEGSAFSIEEIKNIKGKKFIGHYIKRINYEDKAMNSPQYVTSYVGGSDYYVYDFYGENIDYAIQTDIEDFPLVDNGSTIFAALQFALFMHPSRLFIVGCDCSYKNGQHFDGNNSFPMHINVVFENWKKMRDFISTFYPDIEIISVNPVGLKGFFIDYYTDSFMEDQVSCK